jgi:ankyrin repeat protein
MSLLGWPDELLQLVIQYLESERDLNSFAQTNRRHYNLSNDYLYQYHIQHGESSALLWAAYHGRDMTARILLREGANPNVEAAQLSRFPGQTPLAMAAQNGHETIVRLLIASRADPNIKDRKYSMTPLSWAAAKGHYGIVKLLLATNVDPDHRNAVHRTPLSHAVEIGHLAIAKLLLERQADPNTKDTYLNRTPLLWATAPKIAEHEYKPITPLPWAPKEDFKLREAPPGQESNRSWIGAWGEQIWETLRGHDVESVDYEGGGVHPWATTDAYTAILELLLANGADIESRDHGNRTVLSWAAKCGNDAIFAILLANGAHPDPGHMFSRPPLSWVAEYGSVAMADLLLDRGVNVSWRGSTPLALAAKRGHEAIVEHLLSRGADPKESDSHSPSPLSWAAGGGYITIVRLLHKKGASVNDPKNWFRETHTPLVQAAQNGHETVVEYLLQNGALQNSKDWTSKEGPLLRAARNGHLGVVKQLLENSFDHGDAPEVWSFDKWKALRVAASNGHEAVLKYLLENFSWPTAEHKLELLIDGANNGHTAVVKLLLSHSGVDVNGRGRQGMTALSAGALMHHRDVVELLVSVKGIDINCVDKYNWTPLSWAVYDKDESMIKLLLEKGAEQFPYQDLGLKGDPRPQQPPEIVYSSDYGYKLKLSQS